MIWLALFSQTGSEIVKLSKEINRKPDYIVTNNFEDKIKYHPGIKELDTPVRAKHDVLMQYLRVQTLHDPKDVLITLHGYLRIIPSDICEKYEIVNGHPGYITAYPELKGKDPQVRTWEGKYMWIGCVLHKVTAGVDEGPVISQTGVPNTVKSLDEMYSKKKQMSLYLWTKFMWGKLNENRNKRGAIGREDNAT